MPAAYAFFYGTLMSGFDRRARLGLEDRLRVSGRGWIEAALFDLGTFPAAVPSPGGRVWGELVEIADPDRVLPALDAAEGHRPDHPDVSLYVRRVVGVHLDDGDVVDAWAYFYNAPLGRAPRIDSGDYRQHLLAR
jgi:gamma-glutamylcyclotransferase (GGCT)/AIG2-like uncharacterized protein YtfP